MNGRRNSVVSVILWSSLLALFGIIITLFAFLTIIDPEKRDATFYVWLSVICTGELILFAWSSSWIVEKTIQRRISGASRIIIHVMIGIWFFITVLLGATLTIAPRGRYQDFISILYIVLTFLFLAACSAIYTRDIRIQDDTSFAMAERSKLQYKTYCISHMKQRLRSIAEASPENAVRIDRIIKRLDSIESSLRYAAPAKTGTFEEVGPRSSETLIDMITESVDSMAVELNKAMSGASSSLSEFLTTLERRIDDLELMVQHRQRYLL